ncbi:MAG: hypothetical protein ACKVP3_10365 [Hyphomicrobiaceae bacterium]
MAMRRTPLHVARATGRDRVNPARFADRREPKNRPIGDPPKHLGPEEAAAWYEFCGEMDWLRESDRAALELASALRVQVRKPDCKPRTQTLFRTLLCDLGGNPTRRGGVA